jgi:protein-export membrane protein SecD
MARGIRWRLILVLAVLAIAIWQLYPSLRLATLSEEERAQMPPEELLDLQKKAFHLGLDLQGGMYIVLEVDKTELSDQDAEDATERALEIMRNRIDQFGVYEPSIQRQGSHRIVVQLPGVNRERARSLIEKTAFLEFKLVAEPQEIKDVFDSVDGFLKQQEDAAEDSFAVGPFYSHLLQFGSEIVVVVDKVNEVKRLLADAEEAAGEKFMVAWGDEEENRGIQYRPLYVLQKEAQLTGDAIADARVDVGASQERPNEPYVRLTMTRKASRDFASITGANVNRRLAIVLDGVVRSAPVIREKIPGGRSQITGAFTVEEARDLAIILRAGALPAPVLVLEERSVGPSLGADSIRKGVRASIFGGIVVLAFMLIYYSFSGSIAGIAIILNLILLLAFLSAFRATLTLPGIAGVILTVGIAVDANVLIFERIREELRVGKTIRTAIDTGYSRAFRTILDANLTTLFTALILYWFGTGAIKGFAVTLSIGIVVSFFTAIVFTRLIFDILTSRLSLKTLRI